ncbi:hypothetical protein FKP32DRAFT_1688231 [Trametes sanguinea]|nr:hypothetical protein FKP32DRAFT_1688231 [Trametes sanguinea]
MAGRSAHVRRISASTTDESHDALTPSQTQTQAHTRGRSALGRMRTPERRRSSSQGDATPRPPPHTTLSHSHSPAPSSSAVDGSPSTHAGAEHGGGGTKRLGFLGEMLLSSAGSISVGGSSFHSHPQRSSPIPHAFLPHRSHSRSDNPAAALRENTSSPTPTMAASAAQQQKGHTSPSKASSTRTYDSKLVSREMHRLGNLAHLPSLGPSLSATPSNISLAPPPGAPSAASLLAGARPGAEDSPWTSLHVLVLPLFNEEPLRVPMGDALSPYLEDLNQLVKRHIQTVVSAAPGKAVATLEHDTFELIAAGMVTLNAKLAGVEDEKLIPRVVELWSTFWTQVLPYLEGSLLPLQTDPILSSLYRLPKARPASPTSTQNGKPASSGLNMLLQSTAPQIDVRALALVSFRDRVVLPLFPRLYARLTMSKDENPAGTEAYHARSPDPESASRMSMGGWGLSPGRPSSDDGRMRDDAEGDDDPDDPLDWDSAQAVVERMVGMKSDALPPTPPAHQQQYQQQQQQQSQPQSQSQPPPPPHEMRRRMT